MDIYRKQPLHPATSGHWRNDSFDTSEFAGTGVKGGINPTTLLPHSVFFFNICNYPYELSLIQVVAQSFVSLVLLEQENELTSEQNKTILPH